MKKSNHLEPIKWLNSHLQKAINPHHFREKAIKAFQQERRKRREEDENHRQEFREAIRKKYGIAGQGQNSISRVSVPIFQCIVLHVKCSVNLDQKVCSSGI